MRKDDSLMSGGYDQIYKDLVSRMPECDLAERAARLGIEYVPESGVIANFLGRKYIITEEGATPADGLYSGVNSRSCLLYYILSKGSGEPEYSFMPLFRLMGALAGRNDYKIDNIMTTPLLREFANDVERLRAAVSALDGVYEGASGGGHRWILHVLPKIPVQITFYEADEEFPADIQIMFDKTALTFMEFECLAFLAGCLANALIEADKA